MVFRLGGTPSSRGVLRFGLGCEAGARAGAASVRPSGGGAAPSGTAPRRRHSSLYLDSRRWPSNNAQPPAGEFLEKLTLRPPQI